MKTGFNSCELCMRSPGKKSFLYKNSLSIVFLLMAFFALAGQTITGWHEYNDFLNDHQKDSVNLITYLYAGHFLQATFENWESEFLQMALFVWLTVFLRQIGSSESKKLGEHEKVDRKPKSHPNAPWPVRKGGWVLSIYKHSLTLSLVILFLASFILHWYGSYKDFNEKQLLEGKPTEGMWIYLSNNKFWFESFQNWQSEFLSVFAIVFLSIYLRETGSPQSKPVDAPHYETGD
jgi:hypothetical protein